MDPPGGEMQCLVFMSTLLCVAVTVPFTHSGTLSHWTVEIQGPTTFITNGSRDLILKATTTNKNVSLYYSWGGLCFSNTNTCTFRPGHDQDGEEVFCTATDSHASKSVTAKYYVHLKCPPSEPPKIAKSTTREMLLSGDTLTCTVSGGKPPVTSVNFSCTNPSGSLPDRNDIRDGTSVSSSLIVDESMATGGPIVCVCSAEWSPDPTLYQKKATVNFTVEAPSTTDRPLSLMTDTAPSPAGESKPRTLSPMDQKSTDAETKPAGAGAIARLLLGSIFFVVVVLVVLVTFCMWREKEGCCKGLESTTGKKEDADDKQGKQTDFICCNEHAQDKKTQSSKSLVK